MKREESLGDRIRQLREQAGLTQGELAEAVGLSRTSLNKIETGVTPRPHANTLHKLAGVLKVSDDQLLYGKAKDSFLPGGVVNKFGAGAHQPGEVRAQLGENFGEDIDGASKGPSPKTAPEFISYLLAEIDALKTEKAQLHRIIKECGDINRKLQDAYMLKEQDVRDLYAELVAAKKHTGNQVEAPGIYAYTPPTEARVVVMGLKRYELPLPAFRWPRRKRRTSRLPLMRIAA